MRSGVELRAKAGDDQILAFSVGEHAVVVTLDADFHTILAVFGNVPWESAQHPPTSGGRNPGTTRGLAR